MNNFRKRYDSQYNERDGKEDNMPQRSFSYRYDNQAFVTDTYHAVPYKSADFSSRSDHVNGNLSLLPGSLTKDSDDTSSQRPPEHLISKTELDAHGTVVQHGITERRQHLNSMGTIPYQPQRPLTARADICPKPKPSVGQAWTTTSTQRSNFSGFPAKETVSHTVEERLRSLLYNGPSTLPAAVQQNLQNGYEDGELLELPPPTPRDPHPGVREGVTETVPHPFSSGYNGQPGHRFSSNSDENTQGYVPSRPTEKIQGPRSQVIMERNNTSTVQRSQQMTSGRQFAPPPYPGRPPQFQNVNFNTTNSPQIQRMQRYSNPEMSGSGVPVNGHHGNEYSMSVSDRITDGPNTENRLSPSKQYPGDPSRPVSGLTSEDALDGHPSSRSQLHDNGNQGDLHNHGNHHNQLTDNNSNIQHGSQPVQRMGSTDLRDACSRFYGRENRASTSVNSPKPTRSAETQKNVPITSYNPPTSQPQYHNPHPAQSPHHNVTTFSQSKPPQTLETQPRISPMGQSDSPASHNSSQASDTGFMKLPAHADRRLPIPHKERTAPGYPKPPPVVTSGSKPGNNEDHTLPKPSWSIQQQNQQKPHLYKEDTLRHSDIQNGNLGDDNWRNVDQRTVSPFKSHNVASRSPVLNKPSDRNTFEMKSRTANKPPSGYQGGSNSHNKMLITSTPNVTSVNKNQRQSVWDKYHQNKAFSDRNSEFSSSERSVTPPLPPLSPDNTPPATPPESPIRTRPGRTHTQPVSAGISFTNTRTAPNRTPDLVTSTSHRPGPGSTSSGGSRRRRHRRASMVEGLRKWDGGRHRRGMPMALRVSPTKPNPKRNSFAMNQIDDLNESLDESSDDNEDASNTDAAENHADASDIQLVQQQLSGLESMYQEILQMLGVDKDYISSKARINSSITSISNTPNKGQRLKTRSNGSFRKKGRENNKVGRRFQRLESHVVTLARSVAHLSSEMRSQNTVLQEIEEIKKDVRFLKEEHYRMQRGGHLSHPNVSDFERFRGWVPSLTNPKRIRKLTRFFGQEPPLLHIFLKKLGYEKYAPNFEHEKIGMMELPYMTEERMQKIGIPMGPRLRILQESQLCFRQENFDIYIV